MSKNLEIPEYIDTELAVEEQLVHEPAFWLAHLQLTMSADPDGDPTDFGIPAAVYEQMLERLSDPDQPWPVFRVPFAGGHTAYAVYANFEDENTVEFCVRHPSWDRLGHLGQHGPEYAGPGLSWPEFTALASSPSAGATGSAASESAGLTDPAHRMLLLLPMLGDAATPVSAWSTVAEALAHCGFAEDTATRFAQELMGTTPAAHQLKPAWKTTDESPVPVCESKYSPRQIPLALGISRDQAEALASALRGEPAR